MAVHGLNPPDIHSHAKFIRFPGAGRNKADKAGWCHIHEDGQGATFGDFRSGTHHTVRLKREECLDPAMAAYYRRIHQEALQERERERQREYAEAARRAQGILHFAVPASPEHPYAATKQLCVEGLYQKDDLLLIPVCGMDDTLYSVQFIDPHGKKNFLKYGRVDGGVYRIGDIGEGKAFLVCEGYATGDFLYKQTGFCTAVAFHANNLKTIALSLRSLFPEAELVICGDNDRFTEGNPGKTKAEEAALACGGDVQLPDFLEGEEGTDWWDLGRNRGLLSRD